MSSEEPKGRCCMTADYRTLKCSKKETSILIATVRYELQTYFGLTMPGYVTCFQFFAHYLEPVDDPTCESHRWTSAALIVSESIVELNQWIIPLHVCT